MTKIQGIVGVLSTILVCIPYKRYLIESIRRYVAARGYYPLTPYSVEVHPVDRSTSRSTVLLTLG